MNTIQKNELVKEMEFDIVPTDAGLELEAKNSLELAFSGFFTRASEWKKQAESITDPKLARAARLEVRSLRIEAEKKRKEMKADSLLFGKAVDGANNIFLSLITPIERGLDDIEKAEERRIESELKAKVEERTSQYTDYHDDALPFPDLATLDDEQFSSLLDNAKTINRLKIEEVAKLEAERIENERIELEAREAQRLENLKLKAEAEAREKAIAKERAEAEELRKEQEIKEAKERAKIEAKAKKEAEAREKAEAESKRLKAIEADRVAKVEAELLHAQEQEKKSIAEEKAKAKKAANAPDKDKLNEFAILVSNLVVPTVSTPEAQTVAEEISQKGANFATWIKKQASTL